MNIDEILTGTIGFVIAMVIVGAAIAGIIYGYYAYAQHQVLENYLWPVAEAVPAQGGGYWLAVINTGHQPFFVKYLIYPNGKSQRVHTKPLYHNQHWLVKLDQLPAEVMVCSAVDPKVCTTAPVHGYYVVNVNTATFSGPGNGNASGLIQVIVNDPYGAGWRVTWSYAGQTYSMSQSQSYTWYINPPYVPIQVSFTAEVTQNPSANGVNYTCQISPSQVSGSYGPGSVITFNVQCSAEYYVVVQLYAPCHNANYWVTAWTDTQSVSVDGYQGSGTYTLYYTTSNPQGIGQVAFQAGASASFFMGGSLTVYNESAPGSPVVNSTSSWFNVMGIGGWEYSQPLAIDTLPGMVYKAVYSSDGCAYPAPQPTPNNQISVTVSDPYGAGWSITWSGGASGSESGSSTDSWTISASNTVNFNAKITSVPSGYNSCTITPQTTSANPGGSVTFTVSCTSNNTGPQPPQQQCTYTYSTTIDGGYHGTPPNMCTGPSSLSVNSNGQYQCTAQLYITDSQGDKFKFIGWASITVSPSNYGESQGPTPSTFVEGALYCPAPASVSVQGTASYKFIGCTSYNVQFTEAIASNGQGSATFQWQFCPDDSAQYWQASASGGSALTVQAIVYAGYGYGQASISISDACPSGYTVENPSVSPPSGSASGSSGSASFSITYTCAPSGGLNGG